MKYLTFVTDVGNDDTIIFEEGKSYLVTFEDDSVYMCDKHGIEKSLYGKFFYVVEIDE